MSLNAAAKLLIFTKFLMAQKAKAVAKLNCMEQVQSSQ
jgi:hypothetical protein